MASNIAGLINNISDSVTGFINQLLGKGNKAVPYPTREAIGDSDQSIVTEVDPSKWTKTLPYAFDVVEGNGSLSSVGGFSEFELPINPSDLTQDELPAIRIMPTQGGTSVSHNGIRYGDLVISGTTGVHPNRGAGGVRKSKGTAILQPDTLKYRSGYENFLKLRNFFKAYYQYKKVQAGNQGGREAQLIFKNFKDGEILAVELLRFQLKRSANRKTLYDYSLQFKIIGRYSFSQIQKKSSFLNDLDSIIDTIQESLDLARGVFLRTQDILRQIEGAYENTVLETIRKATLAVKALRGIGTTAAELSSRAISNTISASAALAIVTGLKKKQSDFLTYGIGSPGLANLTLPVNPAKAIAAAGGAAFLIKLAQKSDALTYVDYSELPPKAQEELLSEQASALQNPRSFYENTISDLIRIRDNAADTFNLGDELYNSQYQRVSTSKPDVTKQATDQEFQLLGAFNTAIQALTMLLSTNALFKSSYADTIAATKSEFSDGLPSVKAEVAVREVVLPANVDLERLALDYLGDSQRWVEIVELNQLKPPYIVQDSVNQPEQTKKPGDKILIPQPLLNGFGSTPDAKETYYNENLSAIEKNLGVDFKLNSDFDLILSNKGDLELAVAGDNAAQAIVLKLSIERGELLKHPELGVGLSIGNKIKDLQIVRNNLVSSLSADPRFEGVQNVELLQEGSATTVKFEVKLKNVDTPIPLQLRL